MLTQADRFPVFIAVSLLVFFLILRFAMRGRESAPPWRTMAWVSAVVVVGGMLFAKYTQQSGWPAFVYYGLPALVTIVLPPLVFRLHKHEIWQYLVLAYASSPLINVAFSFVFGWHDYMPFMHVPYWRDVRF